MCGNDGHDYTTRLGPETVAQTLLNLLAQRYRHSSSDAWTERIEEGRVLVDGQAARPGSIVRPGQTITWRRPPWNEPDAVLAFDVLFEDDDLLAVAKPAGLPTLPGAGFLHATLLHQVGLRFPGAVPLHRLGRHTSGIVFFARTPWARAAMSRQFERREVGKRYRALASGDPPWSSLTCTTPIGRVPYPPLVSLYAASPAGKPASSRIEVVERRGSSFLCDVRIETGRPHQVRIHLAAAGHPLVGDPLYGPGGLPLAGTTAVPGDPGYRLHAFELSFAHPRTGAPVVIVCEPPPGTRLGGHRGGIGPESDPASRISVRPDAPPRQ